MLLVQLWEHPIDRQQPHSEINLAGNLYKKDGSYILQLGCIDVSSRVLPLFIYMTYFSLSINSIDITLG